MARTLTSLDRAQEAARAYATRTTGPQWAPLLLVETTSGKVIELRAACDHGHPASESEGRAMMLLARAGDQLKVYSATTVTVDEAIGEGEPYSVLVHYVGPTDTTLLHAVATPDDSGRYRLGEFITDATGLDVDGALADQLRRTVLLP